MRRDLGKPDAGMTDEQVREFVSRFMPFYEIGLPRLTKYGFFADERGSVPEECKGLHMKVNIDKPRTLISYEII